MTKGLLFDYEFCFGCHTCEMACKTEHNFDKGQWGIQLFQIGPRKIQTGAWEYAFIPVPTELCDMCADRQAEGRVPTCVHHCMGNVIEFGDVEELAAKAAKKPRMVLFTIDSDAEMQYGKIHPERDEEAMAANSEKVEVKIPFGVDAGRANGTFGRYSSVEEDVTDRAAE